MLRKVQHALFLLSVLLLPLAEWRTFGAPINHRPLTIDLNGFLSASIFDLTFFIFSLAMLPTVAQALRGGRLFSWYLTYWVFGFGLIAITYVALEPSLPFLTPSQVNVIDVRSLIIHFAVAVVVTVYVANVEIWHIVRFSYWFYLAATAVFAILSAVAFSESIYFFVRYPFAVPTQISFPFPGQNVAAPFATICLLGLLGTAIVMRHGVALVVGIPLLILAAALTGSRSNMLVMVVAAAVFCVVYVLYGRREAQITTVSTPFLWRKNLIYIVAGAVGAAAVLASNIDWQPIRRALSIFSNISSDVLIGGMAGSSRRDIWSNALKTGSSTAGAGVDVSSAVESRRFGIGLVTLSGGCKTEGPLIHSLVPDTPYFVRLTMRRDARPSATLEVFSDPQHKQLLGRQSAPLSAVLPHLYLFLSHSGKHDKNFEGDLNDISLAANDAIHGETQIGTGSANLYENLFNGGATPVLDFTSNRIDIQAKVKKIRAYVNLPNAVPEAATRAVLTYQVRLSIVSFTMPIDPPVLFYVGFHDTAVEGATWSSIRNGVLMQFVRDNSGSPHEDAYHAQEDRYRFLSRHIDGKHSSLNHAEFTQRINEEIRCGDGQEQNIANLWKRPILPGDMAKTKAEGFGARIIADKPLTSQISISSTTSKSDAIHQLGERGSTHNVYLDWQYYVGPSSLATFVLFVSSLLAAFAAFTWKHRCSVYFTFYLAVMLQLITIFGLMYAQPYIWIKYFWFVMGIASGLMVARVNDDLDDRPFR